MKKLLLTIIFTLVLSVNAFANMEIGYFLCTESGVKAETKLKIDLKSGVINIFLHDYGIYEVSDRNIKAKRKGIGSDNILRTVNFDRYAGTLTFIAYQDKPYVVNLKCNKVSNKKIF